MRIGVDGREWLSVLKNRVVSVLRANQCRLGMRIDVGTNANIQFDGAATIESVAEVFEWVVKNEEIELVWSGLEGTYSDGQIKRFGHINRLGSLQDVYRNNVKTYSDLRQKAPLL